MTIQNSFCTFRVGNLHLGVEVLRVQEVIRAQKMTRIPGSSEVVRGLMNLRGQIVTALDLRRRLDLPETDTADGQMNVVVRTSDGPVSLLVNEIGDVLVVDRDQFEPPPETLLGSTRDLIAGSYKLDGRLLLVLNLDAVMKVAA
ncbi:MAG: chemotaxis protein CheW [Planctomyces sp.]|nr:chemotaxis protein CheW [Planctomyces sp.]